MSNRELQMEEFFFKETAELTNEELLALYTIHMWNMMAEAEGTIPPELSTIDFTAAKAIELRSEIFSRMAAHV